jgi:hypothetical protein
MNVGPGFWGPSCRHKRILRACTASHKSVAGIPTIKPHLYFMMKNQMTQNPKTRRSLLVGVTLLSLFALSACAGASTKDNGETELELPRFDHTIGGA